LYLGNNETMVRDPRGGHNRKKINEDFFKTWSPQMTYVLGFMYADGALLNTNASSRTYYLLFSNNDLDLLKNIRTALGSDHKIYVRRPRPMEYMGKRYVSNTGYVLRIGNKAMYQDLIKIGLEHRKSNVMKLPDIPKEFFAYFVRGYFDGDGCVSWNYGPRRNYPSLRVLFSSGSVQFLTKLATTISKYLSISSGHVQRGDGASNLIFQGPEAMIVLNCIYSGFDKAPSLKYKYEKYLDYKNNLIGPRVRKALMTSF
jgi:hypothetical protein